MPFIVYILFSKSADRYYTGYCSDLSKRLQKHNSGSNSSTRPYIPWELVYYEEYTDKTTAIRRENEIKRMKSRKYIEKLINNQSK
jgi:putative endonuclease